MYRGEAENQVIALNDSYRWQFKSINKGKKDELVASTHGISVDEDKGFLISNGKTPIRKVVSIPPTLMKIRRGNRPTHYEIVPVTPMSWTEYVAEVRKIVLGPKE